jgi:hypothetical protein
MNDGYILDANIIKVCKIKSIPIAIFLKNLKLQIHILSQSLTHTSSFLLGGRFKEALKYRIAPEKSRSLITLQI